MNDYGFSKAQKNVLFIVFLLLLCFGGGNIYTIIAKQGKETVAVRVAPLDAEVTLEGTPISDTVSLKPGTYSFVATREGFYDKTMTVDIIESEKNELEIFLLPESDEAKELVANSEGENFTYDEATDFNLLVDPIANYIPFVNYIYRIDFPENTELEPNKPVTLKISAPTGYRNAPIAKLMELGFDPSDYHYEFNFSNQFMP